jgi:hypothetical protein
VQRQQSFHITLRQFFAAAMPPPPLFSPLPCRYATLDADIDERRY